jgi:hypothetical protein
MDPSHETFECPRPRQKIVQQVKRGLRQNEALMDRFTKILLAGLTFGVWALVMGQTPASAAYAKEPVVKPAEQQQFTAAGVFMSEAGVTAFDPSGKAFMMFPAPGQPFCIIRDGKMSLWIMMDEGNGPVLKKLDEKAL